MTGRVSEMAVGRWRRGAAAAVAAALGLAALAGPAAGQRERIPEELFPGKEPVPKTEPRSEPLAVAYLAAPYKGVLKGPSVEFRIGAKAPGTSLSPKLVQPEGQSWEGYRIDLFKGNERLSYDGSKLRLGGQPPLSLNLYAFIPETRPVKITRVWAWESDTWTENADEFSILSDTSFRLEANPVINGVVASSLVEFVACVNKRSQRIAECDGESGDVIEDPLSTRPSLLMVARGGPPEWLKEVPTQICIEGQEGQAVRVPGTWQPIPLDEKVDDRWCSPFVKLDFIALREVGLRIGSLEAKKRLDSRFASDKEWRMWAERPKAIKTGGQGVWVQQIVLHPPKSEVSDGSKKLPPPPEAASFEILLTGQLPEGRIRKLWYRSPPFGTDGSVKCEIPSQLSTGKWGSDDLTLADATKLEPQGRLVVTEPYRKANFKQPLALVAQVGSRVYCGVATPVQGQEWQFTATLMPLSSETTTAGKDKWTAGKEKVATPTAPLAPIAAKKGPPVKVIFGSNNSELMDQLSHASKAPNDQGVFEGLDSNQLRFTLPLGSGYRISKCDVDRQPLLQCGPDADGQSLEIAPKSHNFTVPKLIRVTVDFASRDLSLVVQADGPAGIRVQKISDGKLTDLLKLDAGRSGPLPEKVSWKSGDKIKLSLEDPDLHKVIGATIDKRSVELKGDKELELPISAELIGKAISITTKLRLFAGPVTVTARGGEVYVVHGEKTLGVVDGAKQVEVADAKPGDNLTVRPVSPEQEVAKARLYDGQNERIVEGTAPIFTLDRSHVRASEKGDKLAALSLDVDVREKAFDVPDKFRLQPVVQLGKRELLLRSCKVELEDFLIGSNGFVHKGGGYTEVTLSQMKRAPKNRSYTVKLHHDATVCRGLVAVGQPFKAAKFAGLRPDATLNVPFERPGGRVFVGIVSLSKDIRAKELNWRAALKAVSNVFEAGAKEGKYLWGAIYGPQGQLLTTSGDSADYAPFDLEEVASGSKMDSVTGKVGLPFASLVSLIASQKDIAAFEGNVDALIVAEELFGKCGWSDSPFALGSRAAFVRLTGSVSGSREIVSGVRVCESGDKGDKSSVVAEVEVVTKEWSRGAENDVQLEKAIAEAAKGFLKTKQQ
jgi:hypothetical protein